VVADDGQFTLDHNEASAGSTKKHTFEGWVGSGGDLIVWTHKDSTGFQPGLWIGVRTKSGHDASKVSGSYFVSHLINKNSVRGNIDLANGNVSGGTLATIASSGINVSGGSYTVLGAGELALAVTDVNGTGYQAGQASNYTANGIAPVLVTTSVASGGNAGLSPNAPSLMFWILK